MEALRLSLRTTDAGEAKRRQAALVAALEEHWAALRDARPVTLTRRQATALAKRLYVGVAEGEGRERIIAVEFVQAGRWEAMKLTAEEEAQAYEDAVQKIARAAEEGTLEKPLGPIADRLLDERIAAADPDTRTSSSRASPSSFRQHPRATSSCGWGRGATCSARCRG